MTSKQWQEPVQITQGDTVAFTKALPDYPATSGWSLLYALRGNGQDISFTSTAAVDNHDISVPAATTLAWLAGDYQMEGFAVNTDGTRKQIYLSSLKVTPDLATANPDVVVTTHAQRMLASIEQQLEVIAKNILLQTTVEGTSVLRERRIELQKFRAAYKQERNGEIAAENARNGRNTGRKIISRMNITSGGNAFSFGAGNSVFNTQFP